MSDEVWKDNEHFSQQKEKITFLTAFFKDKLEAKNKTLSKLEIREYKHIDLYPQKEFVFSFYTSALTPEEAGILYEELAEVFYETLSMKKEFLYSFRLISGSNHNE